MTEKCGNFLQPKGGGPSYRCIRPSTGSDGLCNICRAAKARGRVLEARSLARYQERRERSEALARERRRYERIGRRLETVDAALFAALDLGED